MFRSSGRRTRNQRYTRNDEPCFKKPESANELVSTFPDRIKLIIESSIYWQQEIDETDLLTNQDPYRDDFVDIDEAFQVSKESERILIDKYKLPEDECSAIAEAIENWSARAISDESYIDDVKKCSSAFIITPCWYVMSESYY